MCMPLDEVLKMAWEDAQDKIREYHIHIYHGDVKSKQKAKWLESSLKELFADDVTGSWDIKVVGPHTKENVELNIKPQAFGKVIQWLQMNNAGLSILVHPNTGNDYRDHIHSSLWINGPVKFKEGFFKPKKTRPPHFMHD